jgi:phosphoglycerate dehydrogenase-like enzyme
MSLISPKYLGETRGAMSITKPLVVGMGRVGSLIALLLAELGMQVAGVDMETLPSIPANIDFTSADYNVPRKLDH